MYDKNNDPRFPRMPSFPKNMTPTRRERVWDWFVWFVIAGAAGVALLLALTAPIDARAQDLPSWDKLNESCQGAPLRANGKDNPDCAARNRISSQLVRQGWQQANHNVWLSPDQLHFAGVTISKYDHQLASNLGEFNSLMPAQLVELRSKLTDAQIFAIWNLRQDDIRANAPYAGAMLEETIAKLAMHYARSGDPRYTIGN